MKSEILRFERVRYIEDDVTLLDNFNLHIFQGEIMGLVCLNIHGKEALIELISQNVPIHYGRVYFNETLVNNYEHSLMTINKVAIIEQRSRLIEDLTVADNIFVLRRGFKKYFINPSVLNAQLQLFTKEIGIDISGKELVASLSPYEKCIVELLRAIVTGCKFIVIRDISSYISVADLAKFHKLLKYYCEKGFSFLYICNHHEEAFKICNRIALMRDGKILKVLDNKEFTNEKIIPYIIKLPSIEKVKTNKKDKRGILSFENIKTNNLRNMTLNIKKRECTVILDKNNTVLTDIVKLMSGEITQEEGNIFVDDVLYTKDRAAQPLKNSVAFINEFPVETMVFDEMSYIDNLCFLLDGKKKYISLNKRIKKSIIREYEPLVGKDIYEVSMDKLKPYSLYNLIYYRIHLYNPKIVFCIQPFSGADMYLRRHIINLINELKKKGITVIILAVNIADSLIVSDRLIVIEEGKFRSEYDNSEFHLFKDYDYINFLR
ncbi:ATP-binding cassette domain-containing protein [Clostridium sp. BSD9I1]|uniref:ATP-binding cassette domain-containing protein n=1 Tax=Clostridium sp. BSD9I1 TaxID=2003589 RepID=UPI00164892F0|nr:ATP-binding cassette domain-containing protein [Clostridium sp. BSD9I1]